MLALDADGGVWSWGWNDRWVALRLGFRVEICLAGRQQLTSRTSLQMKAPCAWLRLRKHVSSRATVRVTQRRRRGVELGLER
jgi:hypothetical protein